MSRTARLAFGAAALLWLGGCAATATTPDPATTTEINIRKADPRVMELAKKAVAERRYKDAQRMLERVLIADQDNTAAQLLIAEVLLGTGRTDQAVSQFRELTKHAEIAAQAQQGLGIALMREGKVEAARGALEAAVEADPKLWRAWNALGVNYGIARDWRAAEAAYEQALTAHSESAEVWNNLGFAQLAQEEPGPAGESFYRALQLDPDLQVAEENLRLAWASQGRYREAVAGVENDRLPQILNNVGYVALLRGDPESAEAYLTQAMEADPTFNRTAAKNLRYLREGRTGTAVAVQD
jgi:Flp pilus assembly protein TadD